MKKINNFEKDIKINNRTTRSNIRKIKKSSDATATGLEAKNNTLRIENLRIEQKIEDLRKDLDIIKRKQEGIIL